MEFNTVEEKMEVLSKMVSAEMDNNKMYLDLPKTSLTDKDILERMILAPLYGLKRKIPEELMIKWAIDKHNADFKKKKLELVEYKRKFLERENK